MREVSRQTAREGRTREGGGVLAMGKATPYTSVHLSFLFFLVDETAATCRWFSKQCLPEHASLSPQSAEQMST